MTPKMHWLAFAAALLAHAALAADSPRFRGLDGGGVFHETGLLESWPAGGPPELWAVDGLGEGYASVTVAGGRIFTTGMREQRGSAFAFDSGGKLLWRKEYGAEHSGNGYPGTRTTPTVDGDTLYLMTSMGKAVALAAATGETRWEVDLLGEYGGKNLYFGIAESPLVLDGKVVFTPGGKDASLVALDKKTGETVWTTAGLSEQSAYCSPRLLEHGGHRQIVTFVEKNLVGVDPDDGRVLWKTALEAPYGIHANSPVFHGPLIYVSHGYNQGGKLFELAADGRSVAEKWSEPKLDVHHGGAVVVDGKIYGAASNKTWFVLDAATGKVEAEIPRLGKGVVIYADGRLYGYTEGGKVLLVHPDPADFRLLSSFAIERGEGQHWAHPAVVNGVLYVRHGDVLMAYDVKVPSPAAKP